MPGPHGKASPGLPVGRMAMSPGRNRSAATNWCSFYNIVTLPAANRVAGYADGPPLHLHPMHTKDATPMKNLRNLCLLLTAAVVLSACSKSAAPSGESKGPPPPPDASNPNPATTAPSTPG